MLSGLLSRYPTQMSAEISFLSGCRIMTLGNLNANHRGIRLKKCGVWCYSYTIRASSVTVNALAIAVAEFLTADLTGNHTNVTTQKKIEVEQANHKIQSNYLLAIFEFRVKPKRVLNLIWTGQLELNAIP